MRDYGSALPAQIKNKKRQEKYSRVAPTLSISKVIVSKKENDYAWGFFRSLLASAEGEKFPKFSPDSPLEIGKQENYSSKNLSSYLCDNFAIQSIFHIVNNSYAMKFPRHWISLGLVVKFASILRAILLPPELMHKSDNKEICVRTQ